jgi:hypothetical protein
MTLKERLERYLRNNHGWVAKGQLEDLVREKTNYTAENTGQRLRELQNDGVLEVQIRKGHAFYRVAQKEPTLF